ncbi:hypothetical protein LZC95_07865 [Pendulispora brunnea]|uniref:Uncharacterized protein n=1 Tax=Pendulispora brunnea TaxID=2905690 RepID=A0ABZ2KDH1_9BACT
MTDFIEVEELAQILVAITPEAREAFASLLEKASTINAIRSGAKAGWRQDQILAAANYAKLNVERAHAAVDSLERSTQDSGALLAPIDRQIQVLRVFLAASTRTTTLLHLRHLAGIAAGVSIQKRWLSCEILMRLSKENFASIEARYPSRLVGLGPFSAREIFDAAITLPADAEFAGQMVKGLGICCLDRDGKVPDKVVDDVELLRTLIALGSVT